MHHLLPIWWFYFLWISLILNCTTDIRNNCCLSFRWRPSCLPFPSSCDCNCIIICFGSFEVSFFVAFRSYLFSVLFSSFIAVSLFLLFSTSCLFAISADNFSGSYRRGEFFVTLCNHFSLSYPCRILLNRFLMTLVWLLSPPSLDFALPFNYPWNEIKKKCK